MANHSARRAGRFLKAVEDGSLAVPHNTEGPKVHILATPGHQMPLSVNFPRQVVGGVNEPSHAPCEVLDFDEAMQLAGDVRLAMLQWFDQRGMPVPVDPGATFDTEVRRIVAWFIPGEVVILSPKEVQRLLDALQRALRAAVGATNLAHRPMHETEPEKPIAPKENPAPKREVISYDL